MTSPQHTYLSREQPGRWSEASSRFAQLGFVTFDYEGALGMPFAAPYDLDLATDEILRTLAEHAARATFFVVGEIAEQRPDLMRHIVEGGHEIGLHGYLHEHLVAPGSLSIVELSAGLARSEAAIAEVTGHLPRGFRAPYLLSPHFYDEAIYDLLAERGYTWVSNWELRHWIELIRPDRIRSNIPWRLVQAKHPVPGGWLATFTNRLLNNRASRRPGAPAHPARRPPFHRHGLLEVPVYAPLDVDLVGLPRPHEAVDLGLLAYADFALHCCCLDRAVPMVLTFHDWVVAGSGRLSLLDHALLALANAGRPSVTISERRSELMPYPASGTVPSFARAEDRRRR